MELDVESIPSTTSKARRAGLFRRAKKAGKDKRNGLGETNRPIDYRVPSRRISLRHLSRRSDEKATVSITSKPRQTSLDNDLIDLDWRLPWLSKQHTTIPANLTSLRIDGSPISNKETFDLLLEAVARYANENRGFSVDDIVEYLQQDVGLEVGGDDDQNNMKRLLVFAVLGWHTMVYQPAFNLCPQHQLAVHQDYNAPESGLVFDLYKVPIDLCDRPLSVLLKVFGNLLPARPNNTYTAAVENSKVAPSWTAMYPNELNAYHLHTLLKVQFRWVDTLALHLDYDNSTPSLSLFRFPSICAAQLESRGDWPGTIFAFATETTMSDVDPRADEEDITHFLQEVLLSYRLLFGQCAKSRKLFRQIFTPTVAPFPQPDSLLTYLCTEAKIPLAVSQKYPWVPRDRSAYIAAREFPILSKRVELIARDLERSRPKSAAGLLRDRRDKLQFWTFWLVAILGASGLLLSLVQIALQGIQIAQEAGKLNL
ncbi:hypothetical protein QBC38DRAFT_492606 [Podospora fimiseda]|uniref:Uncharacterized protein n=1 Tax=Podospora fimiseda TaxID=252190 RepID=A0AAN6YNA9_9PEZI|nr:hypothetical protein QBC38DRAFT_492606 [Podospora fimiseda]